MVVWNLGRRKFPCRMAGRRLEHSLFGGIDVLFAGAVPAT
jgi:hypothetical protein